MAVDPLTPYAEIDVRMPGVNEGDISSADPFAVRPMSQQLWQLWNPQPDPTKTTIVSSGGDDERKDTARALGGGPVYGGVPLDLSPLPGVAVATQVADPAAVAKWLEDTSASFGRATAKVVAEGAQRLGDALGDDVVGEARPKVGGVLGPLQKLRDKIIPNVPQVTDAIDWYKEHAAKDPNVGRLPVPDYAIGLPSEVRRADGSLAGEKADPVAVAGGIPTANDFAGVPARPRATYWTDQPDGFGERVAHIAQQMIGQPVKYGGGDWTGADAPGLVAMAYENAGAPRGSMPRLGPEQVAQSDRVNLKSLRPGDVVAVDRRSVAGRGVDHVAIYVGNGEVVEAPERPTLPIRRRRLKDLLGDGKVTGHRIRKPEDSNVSLAQPSPQRQQELEREKEQKRDDERKKSSSRKKRSSRSSSRRRTTTRRSGSSGSKYYGSDKKNTGNSSKKYSGIGATK